MTDRLRFGDGPMMIRCVRSSPFLLTLLAMAALWSHTASAQVVRGTITERAAGAPIVGAVVTLVRENGSTAAAVLSNERGEYAVRAPAPGRYGIQAKRIGVRRAASALFMLAEGETRQTNVAIDMVTYSQPEILIVGYTACDVRGDESARVAALWDEARTALTASEISQRDRLFKATVVRYVRELETPSLKVLNETRSQAAGVIERPFVSAPAAELSREGYVRGQDDGSYLFYGPDADVLVSDEFLGNHCFRVVEGGRQQRGLVGLAFEPTGMRENPDIRGTLWLDAKSFELRFIDYRYTQLPPGANDTRAGGQVHFVRLSNGAWIVSRWYIRMPRMGRRASPPMTLGGATPNVMVRPIVIGLLEEGGDVQVAGVTSTGVGSITGIARDSSGRNSLSGATVLLSGSGFTTTADAQGRFRFDSVPEARYSILVRHPSYELLGVVAGDDEVRVKRGENVRSEIRGRGTVQLERALCADLKPVYGTATLHVQVVDAVTGGPVPMRPVVLTWQTVRGVAATIEARRVTIDGATNERGGVSFCHLPAERPIQLTVTLADGTRDEQLPVVLPAGAVTPRQVRIGAPR